jgi:hypothetical protein
MNVGRSTARISNQPDRAFPRPFWYEDLKHALQRFTLGPSLAGLPPLPAGIESGPRQSAFAGRDAARAARAIDGAAVSVPADVDLFDPASRGRVSFQRRSGLSPTVSWVLRPSRRSTGTATRRRPSRSGSIWSGCVGSIRTCPRLRLRRRGRVQGSLGAWRGLFLVDPCDRRDARDANPDVSRHHGPPCL